MAEPVGAQLARILQHVQIVSSASFSLAGHLYQQPDGAPPPSQGANPDPTPSPLISTLQQCLYQYCFCQAFKEDAVDAAAAPAPEDNLLQALSEANAGNARWDSGWQIFRVEPSGQVAAHKYGLTRMFWPGEFVTYEGPGIPPRAGSSVSVFFAKESLTMQPGFYFAFGETVIDQWEDYRLVRFYWNIKASGATILMRLMTQALNRFLVPFRLKCLSARAQYARLDSAVLFVNKRFYRIAAELLADLYDRVTDYLDAETPLFTKQLAPGLALAEDPGNGESFGMSRCRILAEGVWNAFARGAQTEQARLQEVVKQFGTYGLSLDYPYLNALSVDQYEFPKTDPLKSHG